MGGGSSNFVTGFEPLAGVPLHLTDTKALSEFFVFVSAQRLACHCVANTCRTLENSHEKLNTAAGTEGVTRASDPELLQNKGSKSDPPPLRNLCSGRRFDKKKV